MRHRTGIAAAALILMAQASPSLALDQAMESDIRALYEQKEETLTGETIDIEKAVAEAEKHTAEEAVFINRLKNMSTGQMTNKEMNKDDLVSQMPDAYGKTRNSEAAIDILEIKAGETPDEAVVTYSLNYNATLQQEDVYSRIIKSDMKLVSQCTETVRLSEQGVIQTTHSECDGALQHSQPEIINPAQ